MVPRQAHGRQLLRGPGSGKPGPKKAKHSIRSTALNAFSIAADQVDGKGPRGPRTRQLDVEPELYGKRRKGPSSNDEDDGDEEDERPRKRIARGDDDDDGEDDSDGLEWRVGVDESDDSEIDSDDAFGESDEDNLAVTRNKSKAKRQEEGNDESEDQEMEGSDDGDDMSSLGSDAIDLATALDQWEESESDGNAAEDDESGSEDDDESTTPSSEADVSDDDDVDESNYDALRDLVGNMQNNAEEEEDNSTSKKARISLKDLGIHNVNDPHIKKSVKILKKEDKNASKPGAAKKLDVPLPQRQQAKLDRSAAYEQTNETLERWTETVKHNRRAEHLVFPLAQNSDTHGVDRNANAPITQKTAANELESTIMAIMEESGLGPSAPRETQALSNENLNKPSNSELKARNAELRRERELKSREDARAKRIKKIKSKAYHRVHRKAEQRKQMKELEALEAAAEEEGGTPLDEQELEDLNRQRAIARMGGKHKDSKWAKQGSKAGRAVWDDEFKAGMKEIARRDQDLRRRIEGKGDKDSGSDSESDSSGSDSDSNAERKRLLREVEALKDDREPSPLSRLMNQPFMRKAEARRKAANDIALCEIQRELASGDEEEPSDAESVDIGRRSYGQPKRGEKNRPATCLKKGPESGLDVGSKDDQPKAPRENDRVHDSEDEPPATNTWKMVKSNKSKKSKKNLRPSVIELDSANASAFIVAAPVEKTGIPLKERAAAAAQAIPVGGGMEIDDTSSSDNSSDTESQADDEGVVSAFAAEKAALAEDEGDKVVDETLPGWGSWVGSGVSKREQARHTGRFLKKVEGVKDKARRDRGKERVMINEKMVKKNAKYLASQLPHPFESREQYERSLRLPVGQEWVTKETFQDGTKPRIIVKQGVIAPMSKPMYHK